MLFHSFWIGEDKKVHFRDSRMRHGSYAKISAPSFCSNDVFFCLIDPKVYDISRVFLPKPKWLKVPLDSHHVIEIMWHRDNTSWNGAIKVYIRIGNRDGTNSLYYCYESQYCLHHGMKETHYDTECEAATFDETFAKVLVNGSNNRSDIHAYFKGKQ